LKLSRRRRDACRGLSATAIPSCHGAQNGAGNVYRHDYDNVAEDIVWRTVQRGLIPLLAAVEGEIARLAD